MYLHEFIVDRGNCMNDKYSRIFLLCNAIVPIIIGTMIYCLIASDVYFVEKIDSLLNTCISPYHVDANFQYMKFIRNYLPDMVWGYSLMFALFICSGNNTVDLLRIFIVAVVFSIAMESLQLTNIVRGTFDVLDIMVEVLSEGIAVFIIQKYYMRRNENEEKI
jgi:hypothetical protein